MRERRPQVLIRAAKGGYIVQLFGQIHDNPEPSVHTDLDSALEEVRERMRPSLKDRTDVDHPPQYWLGKDAD